MVEKMEVSISQKKRISIESSTPVSSHESNAYSNYDERISEEHLLSEIADQIEKMQHQNVQHEGAVGFADPIMNDVGADSEFLRTFFGDMSNYVDSMDPECLQIPNAVVQHPKMDSSTGDFTKKNSVNEMDFAVRQKNGTGANKELQLLIKQAEQQNQMILELQNQLQNFAVIQLQQQRQKLLNEEATRQMPEKIAQNSTVNEAESMRMQSGVYEIGIVSTDELPELPASNQVNSLDGHDSIPSRALRRIPKRTERSKVEADAIPQLRKLSRYPDETNRRGKIDGSLRKKKKKQVRSNVRVQICNDAAHKNSSAYVRKNSTLYSCKECGKKFTHKGNMTRHLRNHTGEKPFKCGECDVAFAQAGNLRIHQRIHTGKKPFKCQICQATFNHKSNLSTHLLIHTNEKPFLCDICVRWFRHKSSLSDHMKIHSGLKPWKCNVCQKLFRQKSNLNRHRKLHTKGED